jgi:hypothetical protein
MKRKNWTNTDAQGLSDAHDMGRPFIGSGLLCARLARDTRGTLPDIHLIRPARSFWGRGGLRPAFSGAVGSLGVQSTTKGCASGLKILVQHRYPGRTRYQGVAHGPISTLEFGGTRGVESQVFMTMTSPTGFMVRRSSIVGSKLFRFSAKYGSTGICTRLKLMAPCHNTRDIFHPIFECSMLNV